MCTPNYQATHECYEHECVKGLLRQQRGAALRGVNLQLIHLLFAPPEVTLWQARAALQKLRQRMTVPQFVLRILSGHKIMKIIEKRFYIESTGVNGGPWQWPMVATV